MATIKLGVRKSEIKQDGTLSLKFRITNGTSVGYITSDYSVKPEQWNGLQVVRHQQASVINKKLYQQLTLYQARLDELNPPKDWKASKISEMLQSGSVPSESLAAYASRYISKLVENGQKSYAQNMGYTQKWLHACFGDKIRLQDVTYRMLNEFEQFLTKNGQSDTTINIRMSHLKALLNAAVNEGAVEYKVFPFRNYKMPQKNVRDIYICKSELAKLRDAEFEGVSAKRLSVARDLFMLSFYCAGINLTDLMDATLTGDILTFVRKKTAEKKTGADKEVSITIQPEARAIIGKYLDENGKLDMGYNYKDYEQFRSFVTKSLNRIGEQLGFEKKLMYYSARKTFVQFGTELGIPLYILEYAIGQTIKESNNRPIFNYIKKMRSMADLAIRTIIDYSTEPEDEYAAPLPEWARRR